MILPLHIIIALTSVFYTAYVYLSPSRSKLQVSYTLVALTVASGTYLVWSSHSHMLQGCMTGLMYLGAMFFALIATHHKLARVTTRDDS